MKSTSIYTLSFQNPPDNEETVVFYVGRTNDPERRLSEHKSKSKDLAELTYKYQIIRKLDEHKIDWEMTVIAENISDETESEFEYVLLFARHNQNKGVTFINGYPLANMKAGDILTEIIDDYSIVTNSDIKRYRAKKKIPKSKLSIAKRYNTWSGLDQASAIHNLCQTLLKFFDIKERDLSKVIRQNGDHPTPRTMIQFLFLIEPDETWNVRDIEEYLEYLELADELNLL
jgi:hypothetical protein